MTGKQTVVVHWRRWVPAALLAVASIPLFNLPLLLGGDVITWPSTLAAILGGPTLLLAGLGGVAWTSVRDRHTSRSSGGRSAAT